MMQETSAPITLNELVPTIVESLGKDYSEFGSSIHDFNDGELRERTVYIRDFDESKPPVPCYDGLRDGKVNAYRVYTYTGGEAEFVNALYGDDVITIPMIDSYFNIYVIKLRNGVLNEHKKNFITFFIQFYYYLLSNFYTLCYGTI